MISLHLQKRGALKSVMLNNKSTSDLYLTDKLKKYYGIQAFSGEALAATQFGVIGALATLGLKSCPGRSFVEKR